MKNSAPNFKKMHLTLPFLFPQNPYLPSPKMKFLFAHDAERIETPESAQ